MKKAQVAMEYLETYGWALLVIIVVLGVVITIFSNSNSFQYCIFKQKGLFTCSPNFVVVEKDGVNYVFLSFTYIGNNRIEVLNLACAEKDENYEVRLLGNAELGGKTYFSSGEIGEIKALNCGENKGDKFEGVVVIEYKNPSDTYTYNAIAEIRSPVYKWGYIS